MSTTEQAARTMATCHILIYGLLLGTQFWQTLIMPTVSFRTMPRTAITQMQKAVFPVYFKTQMSLIALTAFTRFYARSPSIASPAFIGSADDWISLGIAFVMSMMNHVVYGPRTSKAMMERVHQEQRDGRRHTASIKSDEMKALNERFNKAHAMSMHLNMITAFSTLVYGVRLASTLNLGTC